ncbi:Regulator SirB [Rubrivivax sp. A210]|uniref:SirB2 family protein n=1 Tax=Rubrivivax sp. A210 TaxID=2772301 RepID=UPI00191B2795|nr:SirB2 family protein [Rubrivivax sp. A210]CAD5366789.1 Regulator SirB [Rubrivivax sp. A210]
MHDVAGWYWHLKLAHIGLVLASGGLFALRGALVLTGRGWAMGRPWRMLSYGIDTLLLTAGLTLWAVLSLNPISSAWLGAKLLLLVLYIVLGLMALKRARTPATRRASYAGALMVYMIMASVALAQHPLGFLHRWASHGG